MDIPRVDNGKFPDEAVSARQLFWLPSNTPYGNLQLKLFKVIERVDELNRRIKEAFALWSKIQSNGHMIPPILYCRHVFVLEQCVFLMRRLADELIAIIYCLNALKSTGKFPCAIKIDRIGALLCSRDEQRVGVFGPHLTMLETLNNISNAYKHSFINSDHTLVGAEEPCIHALDLKWNTLENRAQFYNVPFAALVADFDHFYGDAISWLRKVSEKLQ